MLHPLRVGSLLTIDSGCVIKKKIYAVASSGKIHSAVPRVGPYLYTGRKKWAKIAGRF
jgi:hypothetical protein